MKKMIKIMKMMTMMENHLKGMEGKQINMYGHKV
ncbi:hypothetical protein PFDG_00950 [Plasmodium falciparum Dd2]|uniref:Uncharacterized protein n=1 Tax=Plasmodium falciparum (isolate Dd2) TaxID=57267 RepID=A0A0L7LY13_PLAF4|nr:hypothetical protein PFDG_00950 [Plasmodium falciparum Dd2]